MKENSRNQEYKVTNAAHGSVVIGIKPVTKKVAGSSSAVVNWCCVLCL